MTSFIIYSLAVWRLSSLLSIELGPFDIFEKFRLLIGVKYNEYSQAYGTNVIAEGILCKWCNSIWLGIIITIIDYFNKTTAMVIMIPFAISALSLIADRIINND